MFTKIILFFRALREAYQKVNAEKLESKKDIKEVKNLLKSYKNDYEDIKTTYEYLDKIYNKLPYSQRTHYVQQTLDLIKYGFMYEYDVDGKFGRLVGAKKSYFSTTSILSAYKELVNQIQVNYNSMKKLYKQRNYACVIAEYNFIMKEIELFDNKYIHDVEEK